MMMKTKRSICIAIMTLFFCMAWGYAALAAEPADLPVGWSYYSNPEAGFAFGYPSGWTLETSQTPEPMAGWRVRGSGLDIYTYFLGGFEQYEEMGTRSVSLADGTLVNMGVYREAAMLPGDVIEDPNRRLILVDLPDIGPSGLLVYSYDTTIDPGAPDTIERLLATFTILKSSGGASEIPSNWKAYSGSLSFSYPPDWEVTEDFVYETAGGATADVPSITLAKIGDDDSNNWIRINPRQFQTEYGTCLDAGAHTVCTYSADPGVVDLMGRIVSTFSGPN